MLQKILTYKALKTIIQNPPENTRRRRREGKKTVDAEGKQNLGEVLQKEKERKRKQPPRR